jgi:hypothetical protein
MYVFHNPEKGWIFNDGLIFITLFYVGIFAIEYSLLGFRISYGANHVNSLRESDGIYQPKIINPTGLNVISAGYNPV